MGLRGLRQRFHTGRLLSPFRFGNRIRGRDIIGRRRARRAQSVSVRRPSWRGGRVLRGPSIRPWSGRIRQLGGRHHFCGRMCVNARQGNRCTFHIRGRGEDSIGSNLRVRRDRLGLDCCLSRGRFSNGNTFIRGRRSVLTVEGRCCCFHGSLRTQCRRRLAKGGRFGCRIVHTGSLRLGANRTNATRTTGDIRHGSSGTMCIRGRVGLGGCGGSINARTWPNGVVRLCQNGTGRRYGQDRIRITSNILRGGGCTRRRVIDA